MCICMCVCIVCMCIYIYIYIWCCCVPCISTSGYTDEVCIEWTYTRGGYLHMKCTRRTDLDGVHVFVIMAVILTDNLFSCFKMPKKKKSPKRKAETQPVARRLGVIDEDELFGGPSDEEHPEELARFAELQWRNPVEVGEKQSFQTLPPGVTAANIAGPGQSDPRMRREIVPGPGMALVWQTVTEIQRLQALEDASGSVVELPRTDKETTASPTPSTPAWGSTDTSTSSASPECRERWPGDDSPERLEPLDKSVPDHVCNMEDDPMCTFPQRRGDPDEVITCPRQVGLHVCRPRDPWCQDDHRGRYEGRKGRGTERPRDGQDADDHSALLVREMQPTSQHYVPKSMDRSVCGP